MSWGRLDDGFHDHPKVEEISLAAVGLWTLCLSRALRHRKTDAIPGYVPEARVRKLAGSQTKKLTTELVTPPPGRKHGLWEPIEGGWLIHDFADYLPRRRDPEEAAESGRKGAEAKWAKEGRQIATSQADSHHDSQQTANQEASSGLDIGMAPDGSHAYAPEKPVPSRPERTTTQEGGDRTETLRAVDATQHPAEPPPTPRTVDESRCSKHPDGNLTNEPCAGCARVREHRDRTAEREAEKRRREIEDARRDCDICDGTGVVVDPVTRLPTKRKCNHHRRAS